jgi:hypothetical protein
LKEESGFFSYNPSCFDADAQHPIAAPYVAPPCVCMQRNAYRERSGLPVNAETATEPHEETLQHKLRWAEQSHMTRTTAAHHLGLTNYG